jgi:hypothetical protein
MTRYPLLIAALGIGVAASPAFAQAIDPDVKCMLTSDLFARMEKDPGRKQLSSIAAVFYFGRVDARLSPAQVRSQILALDKAVKPADLPAVMTDCARRLQTKQKAFVQLTQSLAAAAKPQTPPAKPAAK